MDIDEDFVQKQGEGTEEGALDYVNSIWSAVNNIYEEEVGLHFNIKHIRITSEWETDASGNSYQSDWGSNQIIDVENRMLMKHNTNVTFWQEHDLYHAHLSRFQWGGHAKQVGALCNPATSASVTTDLRGNLGKLGYLSFDLYITSHELGHNAGSHHTHSTTQTSLPWIAVMTRINAAKWMTTLGQSCLIATCVTQEKFIQRLVELIVEREISAELQIGTTTPTCKVEQAKIQNASHLQCIVIFLLSMMLRAAWQMIQ